MPYINTGPNVVNKRRMYDYCYFSTITVMYEREKLVLFKLLTSERITTMP